MIPPAKAFAVDGQIDPRVEAALAEARRIRDGLAQSAADARRQAIAQGRQQIEHTLRVLHQHAEEARRDAMTAARDLAIELATRVVSDLRAERVDRLLARARQASPDADWIRLRVHPDWVDALSAAAPGTHVDADPGLAPGDLLIDLPTGRVDARVRTDVARLASS